MQRWFFSASLLFWSFLKMKTYFLILVYFIYSFSGYRFEISHTPENPRAEDEVSSNRIREINAIIKQLLEYLKNTNVTDQPLPLPDPLHRPDHVFEHLMIRTTNVTVYGISSIRIENFTSDLVTMKINFNLRTPKLLETGYYACNLAPCSGNFIFSIVNALWNCSAELKITTSGNLALSKIELDMIHRDDMKINIQNAGLIGVFINSFGDLLFDGMKSFIMGAFDSNLKTYLNEQFKHLSIMLPNSLPPLDTFAMEARKSMKNSKYDPYHIPSFQYGNNVFLIEMKNIYVQGITSLYRTGDMKAYMQNHSLHTIMNFGTTQLNGGCDWEIILPFYAKFGIASFEVDHINIFLKVEQSLDITKKPVINEFDVNVGNVQLTLDGSSIFEYIAEFSVNFIANLLRNHIVKIFHARIIKEIEDKLCNFNIEDVIFEHLSFNEELPTIDSLTESLRSIIRNIQD